MDTVTIPRAEYEELKRLAEKIKKIDETIHEELTTSSLMYMQEKQKSFDFLREKAEDIYSERDVKKKWKEGQ